jgi:hypothetical protein
MTDEKFYPTTLRVTHFSTQSLLVNKVIEDLHEALKKVPENRRSVAYVCWGENAEDIHTIYYDDEMTDQEKKEHDKRMEAREKSERQMYENLRKKYGND